MQDPAIFRTLVYSEPWYIHNLRIFRTKAHSEPWYIQKPDTFRTRDIFRTLPTSTMKRFTKIVIGYKYFRKLLFLHISFSRPLFYKTNIGLIFTPEVFIPCKKVWRSRGPGHVKQSLSIEKKISRISLPRITTSWNKKMIYLLQHIRQCPSCRYYSASPTITSFSLYSFSNFTFLTLEKTGNFISNSFVSNWKPLLLILQTK